MVRYRREWNIHRRRPVHECNGPECRLSGWCDVRLDTDVPRDWPLVECPQLHPEIVWMLPVVQRLAVVALATLEQERISARRDGPRIEAQHGSGLEAPAGELVARHEHSPVERTR